MVGTALTIEIEIKDARSTRDVSVGSKGGINLLLVWGRGKRLLFHTSFRTRARIGHLASQDRGYVTPADNLGM